MQALKFGFGQSVLRKEDDPLLRGVGRYIGDVAPGETLHPVVLWSPHAHARFHLDAAQARAMPGVHLVLTGAETDDIGLLPCTVELPNTVLDVPPYAFMARNEARHVGDAIAFVMADTLEQAKDERELTLPRCSSLSKAGYRNLVRIRTRGNPLRERGMPSYRSLHRPQQRCGRVREMRPSCRGAIIDG
jgi:xanthine dehydrogenase molybdopterin-binding subunit B